MLYLGVQLLYCVVTAHMTVTRYIPGPYNSPFFVVKPITGSFFSPAGTIDEDEMMEFLQSVYGFRQKDSAAVRTIFKQLDRNNDKQIQAEEFVAGFNAYAVFAGVQ